jgi:hypothetical protein
MKLHDFGLWFRTFDSRIFSTTIPQKEGFYIMYDGSFLGYQTNQFNLRIFDDLPQPFIINLNNIFKKDSYYYNINRLLTLDDFEIVRNPSRPLNQ